MLMSMPAAIAVFAAMALTFGSFGMDTGLIGESTSKITLDKPRKKTRRPRKASMMPKLERVVGGSPAADKFAAKQALKQYWVEFSARKEAIEAEADATEASELHEDSGPELKGATPLLDVKDVAEALDAKDVKDVASEAEADATEASELYEDSGPELKGATALLDVKDVAEALDVKDVASEAEADATEASELHEDSGPELKGATALLDVKDVAEALDAKDVKDVASEAEADATEASELHANSGPELKGATALLDVKDVKDVKEASEAEAEALRLGKEDTTGSALAEVKPEAETTHAAAGAEAAVAEQAGKAKLNAESPNTHGQVQGLAELLKSINLGDHVGAAEVWCKEYGAEYVSDLKGGPRAGGTWSEQLAESLGLQGIPAEELVAAIKAWTEPMGTARSACLTSAFRVACHKSRNAPNVKDLSPVEALGQMKFLADVLGQPPDVFNLGLGESELRKLSPKMAKVEVQKMILTLAMKAAPDEDPTYFNEVVESAAEETCGPGPSCTQHAAQACAAGRKENGAMVQSILCGI